MDTKERIENIDKKIDTIHALLVGNTAYKQRGIIEMVHEHDDHIKNQKLKMAWYSVIAASFATFLGLLDKYWHQIFK